MATFAPVIRYKKSDGLYAVYIRVSQGQGKLAYIKTCFSVGEKVLKEHIQNQEKKQSIFLIQSFLENALK